MYKVLQIAVLILGALLVVVGLLWGAVPETMAERSGITFVEGMGRSTLIGDFGSHFFATGVLVLLGLYTRQSQWLYGAAIAIATTGVWRFLAWIFHDAPFASTPITIEIIATALFATMAFFQSKSANSTPNTVDH